LAGALILTSMFLIYANIHLLSLPPMLRPIWFEWSPEIIEVGDKVVFQTTLENTAPWEVSGEAKLYIQDMDELGEYREPVHISSKPYRVGPGGKTVIGIEVVLNTSGFHKLIIDFGGRTRVKQLIHVYDPNKAIESYTFAFFADNRPGGPLTPQPEQFKKLIKILNVLRPDFAILGGDIVYGYRSQGPVLAWQWIDFLSVIGRSRVPIFIAPGNHEVKTGEAPSTGDPTAQIILLMNIGRLYHAFAYGDSAFILLDTDIVGEANNIMGRQKEWLENILRDTQGFRYRFTFMHKPAYSGPHFRTITNDKEITKLFREYNVTVAFQAHNHIFYKRYLEPTWFYVSGGAGSPLYVSPDEGAIYHMLLVRVDREGVEIKVIPTEMFEADDEINRMSIRHGFTQEIRFRRGGEEWTAYPKPVEVKGFIAARDKRIVGEGYTLLWNETIYIDGAEYLRYEFILEPGGYVEVSV